MTTIVALSDTHNNCFPLPPGDILIHAGDLTGRGSLDELKSVAKWLKSLRNQFKHRIVIAGNHDFGLEQVPEEAEALFDKDLIYLNQKGIIVEGIKIYGSPYTPMFYNWAFMKNDDVISGGLKDKFAEIDDNTELLITHGPVYGILDMTAEGVHAGSKALKYRLKSLKRLKAHICGHIHEGYGYEKVGKVDHYNVSVLNRQYQRVNEPTIIEL